jgi:hypothetical protein
MGAPSGKICPAGAFFKLRCVEIRANFPTDTSLFMLNDHNPIHTAIFSWILLHSSVQYVCEFFLST